MKGGVVIFSFGQEVGCQKILYDVGGGGGGGGGSQNILPFKTYPLPPTPPAVYIMNAALVLCFSATLS